VATRVFAIDATVVGHALQISVPPELALPGARYTDSRAPALVCFGT